MRNQRTLTNRPSRPERQAKAGSRTQRRMNTKNAIRNRALSRGTGKGKS